MLEVLLGFSLILMALLAVFRLFPTSERAVVLSDRTAQAYHFATELLDDQLQRHFSALTVGSTEGVKVVQHSLRRGVPIETEFHYRMDITRPYSGRDIYHILVSVSWRDGSNEKPREASVVLEAEKGRLW